MLGSHFVSPDELDKVLPQAISVGFLFFFFFLRLVALCVSLWVGGVPLAAFSPPPVFCFWVVGLGVSLAVFLHLASLLRVG